MNFNFINNGQHDQDNKFHNPLLYNFNSTVTNTENTNWNSANISNDYNNKAIPLESPTQNSIANINSSYMNRKLLQNSYFLQQGSFIPGDPNMPADEDVIDENEGWLQEGGVDMDIIDNMTKDEDEDEHMGFQFD
ncbi:unnamed protein product [Hanseniaspora opuntiae]